jgi:peptidoglycan/xylan/chitin deacetylase (PgdA/CDA1 family)
VTGVILLYHRIGDAVSDPWALVVPPEQFEEQLIRLREEFELVPLQQLAQRSRTSRPAVSITFDDGYGETAEIAHTILSRLSIPATVFVPSGAVDAQEEFWWDELERLLLGTSDLPEHLVLPFDADPFEYWLGQERTLSRSQLRQARSWRAWQEPAPTRRHALYAVLWRLCHSVDRSRRCAILRILRGVAGDDGSARSSHRAVSSRQLECLCRSGLIEIGGHTVSHPSLAGLPPSEQSEEVRDDRMALIRMTGQPIDSFAYPFGKTTDYTDITKAVVSEAGYTIACSNIRGAVHPGSSHLELPRLFVADCSADELIAQVSDALAEVPAAR